jgi:hypothetical protein
VTDRTSPQYRARQRLRHRARSLGWTASRNPASGWTLTNAAGVVGKDLTDEQAAELIAAASVASNLRDGRLALALLATGCGCAGGGRCSCRG